MDNRSQDRLSELFEQAVELPPEARSDFIKVCSDDPAIRSELRSLLAAHDRTPNLLERIAGDVLPAALQAVADDGVRRGPAGRQAQPLGSDAVNAQGAAAAFDPGTRLGSYDIEGRIAAGGIGVVYRALDTTLQRPVAIKTLAWSAPDARESILREARAASALNHPRICTIYEVGEHEGIPFIAMEYLDGRPLRDVIPGDGLPSELLVRYGIQVAEAVEHAHRHGIIHRDLKSANVMISAESQAKVLDFGLASRVPAADMETLTRSRVVEASNEPLAGTLASLAPELLRGGGADKRSDVWSLGVLLYEMAAGQLPFRGATPFELTAAIVDGAPAPLPAKLPVGLRAVIGRCLARNPAERYQHGGEVRVALETLQLGTNSGVALRESTVVVAPLRRRRGALVVAGVVALVLAGGAALMLFNAKRTLALTDRDTLLVADFVNTTRDSVFDGALKQALSIHLEQSPFLSIVSREEVRDTLRLMTKSPDEHVVGDVAREACQRLGAKAMIEGSIAPVGSHYAIGLDALNCESGKTIAGEQTEAGGRDQVLKALGTAATSLRRKLGESLPTIQRFNAPLEQATTGSLEALKAFSVAEDIRSRTSEIDTVAFYRRATELDPNFAIAYARLSSIYGNINQSTEMKRNIDEAYARRDRVSERERFYIDGRHCVITTDPDCYTNVAELWKRTYPRDSMAHGIFADSLYFQGNCAKAVEDAAEAVRLAGGRLSQPYGSLARIHLCLGNTSETRRTLDEATARHLEGPIIYIIRYRLGFFERDDRAMTMARQWAAGRSEEFVFAGFDAEAAAVDGRMRRSRELRLRAEQLAGRFNERVAAIRAHGALYEAAQGNLAGARALIRSITVDVPPASTLQFLIPAAVLARDYSTFDSLLPQRARSASSGARPSWEELARVLRDMNTGDRSAILRLPAASAEDVMERRVFRAYLRGLIHLQARDGATAAAEFQRILDHRGASTPSPLYPLAYIQQARAYTLTGDQTKARKAYEDFFALWKDADPDIPILREAKAEYARLTAHGELGQRN
jgi:tetratricopeptide (TPR) repeat protein/predicted Ser/Thr protein kinase